MDELQAEMPLFGGGVLMEQSPKGLAPSAIEGVVVTTDDSLPDKILPSWEDASGIWMILPNCIARTALFGISNNGKLLKRTKIASAPGIDLLYTGGRLVQSDLDVWYGVLSLSKAHGNVSMIAFGVNQFLKLIERSTGKSDREWLKMSMAKLGATSIEVKFNNHTYCGSLIDEFIRDERTGKYIVKLNMRMAHLFAPDAWSTIDFKQRVYLRRKPLAQWLHAFYSTHRNPLDYSVRKIMELCASESGDLSEFRKLLRSALKAMEEVTGWTCRIEEEADTVTVRKSGVDRLPAQIDVSKPFTEFWNTYHERKRINFHKAWVVWSQNGLDAMAAEIMEGLALWNKSADWHADSGRWIPAPDKWLEGKRWLDKPTVKKSGLVKIGNTVTHEHGAVDRDYGEIGSF